MLASSKLSTGTARQLTWACLCSPLLWIASFGSDFFADILHRWAMASLSSVRSFLEPVSAYSLQC